MQRMKESIMLKHEYSGRSVVRTNGARCLADWSNRTALVLANGAGYVGIRIEIW